MYIVFEVCVMSDLKDIISSNLRRICKDENISQVKLSELSGIAKTTIGHYFTGHNLITVDNLVLLCNVLNCYTNEVLGRFNEEAYVSEVLKDEKLKGIVLYLSNNPSVMDIVEKICK
jgi:transcriptional regulator with XRE-family HTH domain